MCVCCRLHPEHLPGVPGCPGGDDAGVLPNLEGPRGPLDILGDSVWSFRSDPVPGQQGGRLDPSQQKFMVRNPTTLFHTFVYFTLPNTTDTMQHPK